MSSFPPGQVSHGVRMKLCVGCAEVRYVYTCSLCNFKKGRRGFGERPARGKHPVRLKCNVSHFCQGCEGRKGCAAFSPEQLNPRAHRQGSPCKGCTKTATQRTSKYVVLHARGSFLFRVSFFVRGGEVCVCKELPRLLRPDMGCGAPLGITRDLHSPHVGRTEEN